jgi:hypothetical protein
VKEHVLHGIFGVLTVLELTEQEREQACPVWANENGECLLIPIPRTLDELRCRLGWERAAVGHHTSRTPHARDYCRRGYFGGLQVPAPRPRVPPPRARDGSSPRRGVVHPAKGETAEERGTA